MFELSKLLCHFLNSESWKNPKFWVPKAFQAQFKAYEVLPRQVLSLKAIFGL